MVPGLVEAAKENDCCAVIFATSENARDRDVWLEMGWPEGSEPAELLSDLKKAGWDESGILLQPLIPINGVVVRTIKAEGTGFRGTFAGVERGNALRRARKVLKKHGYANVGVYVMTMADMF